MSMSAFEAAEIAMEKAINSDRVASAKNLESILGGNGEYTGDVAFEIWQTEMAALGFAENAYDPEDAAS